MEKNTDKNTQVPQSLKTAVMRCGLSEVEFTERERLIELKRSA